MNNRAGPGQAYIPTDVEHLANMVTHGVSVKLFCTVYWNNFFLNFSYEKAVPQHGHSAMTKTSKRQKI